MSTGVAGALGKETFTRLIGKYGSNTEVVLTSFPAATFDIITQERTDGVPVNTPIIAMISEYDEEELDGTVIVEGDLKLDVDSTVIIDKTMRFDLDGGTYRIINIKKIKPSTVLVGYQIQVRR